MLPGRRGSHACASRRGCRICPASPPSFRARRKMSRSKAFGEAPRQMSRRERTTSSRCRYMRQPQAKAAVRGDPGGASATDDRGEPNARSSGTARFTREQARVISFAALSLCRRSRREPTAPRDSPCSSEAGAVADRGVRCRIRTRKRRHRWAAPVGLDREMNDHYELVTASGAVTAATLRTRARACGGLGEPVRVRRAPFVSVASIPAVEARWRDGWRRAPAGSGRARSAIATGVAATSAPAGPARRYGSGRRRGGPWWDGRS